MSVAQKEVAMSLAYQCGLPQTGAVLKGLFSFSRPLDRETYWRFRLFRDGFVLGPCAFFFFVTFYWVLLEVTNPLARATMGGAWVLWVACFVLFMVPTVSATVRRLRDAGHAPGWALFFLLPFQGVWITVLLSHEGSPRKPVLASTWALLKKDGFRFSGTLGREAYFFLVATLLMVHTVMYLLFEGVYRGWSVPLEVQMQLFWFTIGWPFVVLIPFSARRMRDAGHSPYWGVVLSAVGLLPLFWGAVAALLSRPSRPRVEGAPPSTVLSKGEASCPH
jgi:uncharacterized membrane protein YhaH (DUF805 family)